MEINDNRIWNEERNSNRSWNKETSIEGSCLLFFLREKNDSKKTIFIRLFGLLMAVLKLRLILAIYGYIDILAVLGYL